MMRTYGRKIPVALPRKMMLDRVMLSLPSVVDLRKFCGPMKDQGAEGSCTAHAGTSANEWIHRAYLKSSPIFSPQYTYAKELIAQGDFPEDDGSDGTTLCQTLVACGCCEFEEFPYIAGQITRPTAVQDANAAKFRLGAYHGLTGSQVALSVLGDPVPWPVELGFTVYSSFESEEVARTGIYNPQPGEQVLGGHEVLMVGYDIGETPSLRPGGCPKAVLIQNSWGSGWAVGGFFWMALSVLDAGDTDLKIVHSGHPWAP